MINEGLATIKTKVSISQWAVFMHVVIGGAGDVGFNVAKALRSEGNDVVLIDTDQYAYERAQGLDVLVLRGNCADPSTLREANIDTADMFIGATGDSEVNMIACGLAKSTGSVKTRTIARISSPEYLNEPSSTKYSNIGIDVAVCPELVAAMKISRILSVYSLTDIDIFAKGKIGLATVRVVSGSAVEGKALKDVALPEGCNIVSIYRAGEVIIPQGSELLIMGDDAVIIYTIQKTLAELESTFGSARKVTPTFHPRKIIIAGATNVGLQLAQILEGRMQVTLIEPSDEEAENAARRLKKTLVIRGDATDIDLLKLQEASSYDVFIGAGQKEEYNILGCLIAKDMGIKRTVALINQPRLEKTVESLGVRIAICPRLVAASAILQHARRADVSGLAMMYQGMAEALEITVKEGSNIVNKPIRKTRLPEHAWIAAILRGEQVIVPHGNDIIYPGDKILIFARTDVVPDVERVLISS